MRKGKEHHVGRGRAEGRERTMCRPGAGENCERRKRGRGDRIKEEEEERLVVTSAEERK